VASRSEVLCADITRLQRSGTSGRSPLKVTVKSWRRHNSLRARPAWRAPRGVSQEELSPTKKSVVLDVAYPTRRRRSRIPYGVQLSNVRETGNDEEVDGAGFTTTI